MAPLDFESDSRVVEGMPVIKGQMVLILWGSTGFGWVPNTVDAHKRRERNSSDICARPTCQILPHSFRFHLLVDSSARVSSHAPLSLT
ncbi:unnamed protein product [Sphenostylis stenocarpa]|uniref:Uncharacterized protein n=1 Tax=Sphenostylis stenocarpa TaxID=92480 RepID=A0AA86W5P6_9FABA|nr:unnamed protein product [Sphenostylis stenocarpa]